jgi:hypothetical protein
MRKDNLQVRALLRKRSRESGRPLLLNEGLARVAVSEFIGKPIAPFVFALGSILAQFGQSSRAAPVTIKTEGDTSLVGQNLGRKNIAPLGEDDVAALRARVAIYREVYSELKKPTREGEKANAIIEQKMPEIGRKSPAETGEDAFAPNARARALLKGIEISESDLISAGGSYSLDEVRQLLRGVSRQRIEKRVSEGSLLAVPGPSNRRRFPAVQFNNDGAIVNGLQRVLRALPTKNGFAALNFLTQPDHRIGNRKPIELLKEGNIELVVDAATKVGEQGA